MVVNVEVPPFVGVRVIGDLLGAPAIRFQLDLVLREIEEGEVSFGLPPPVQGVLPGRVTFWRTMMAVLVARHDCAFCDAVTECCHVEVLLVIFFKSLLMYLLARLVLPSGPCIRLCFFNRRSRGYGPS